MAYYVAFHVHRHKMIWIILMTLPCWTSYLLRVFAWKIILGYNGVINSALKALGLIDQPLEFLLYSPTAVVITLALERHGRAVPGHGRDPFAGGEGLLQGRRVAALMRQQRPLMRLYTDDTTTLEQALASGEMVAAMT